MIISEKRRMEVNESGGLQRLDVTRSLRRPGSKPLPEQQLPQIHQIPRLPPNKPITFLQIITILLLLCALVVLSINYIEIPAKNKEVPINRLQEIKGDYFSYLSGESQEQRMRRFRQQYPEISEEEWGEFVKYIGEQMSCYYKDKKVHCEADL